MKKAEHIQELREKFPKFDFGDYNLEILEVHDLIQLKGMSSAALPSTLKSYIDTAVIRKKQTKRK